MKPEIHPAYQVVAFTCSCGNVVKIGSTMQKDKVHLDICDKCHPFYTGKQQRLQETGRLHQFRQRYARPTATAAAPAKAAAPVVAKAAAKTTKAKKTKADDAAAAAE